MVLPEAMKALLALSKATHGSGVPAKTIHLVHLRASQINGCAVCVEMHANARERKSGDTDQRLHLVAAWREAPYFTDAERAALALTEALTRVADRPEAVTDEIWNEAARHYDERALGLSCSADRRDQRVESTEPRHATSGGQLPLNEIPQRPPVLPRLVVRELRLSSAGALPKRSCAAR